jgi:hypothetical protein
MRSQQFIEALYEAGWLAVHDAQHNNITELWKKLFPTVAELECEVEDLTNDLLIANQAS